MSYTCEAESFDEAIKALEKFEFPVRIRDTTGLSDDPDYPEECKGEIVARLRLDWIFEFHNEKPVLVEISGHPKILAQHIKENGVAS